MNNERILISIKSSKLKTGLFLALIIVLVTANIVALNAHNDVSRKLEAQRTATIKEKKHSQSVSKRLSEVSREKTGLNTTLDKERKKVDKLEKSSKRLERENRALKAKKEARLAKQKAQVKLASQKPKIKTAPKSQVQVKRAPVAVSGSCESWIASAGIKDLANARELIRRESGCNPNAVNPSSGACGVAQELPCGKSGCSLGDGACQVAWMNKYVKGRYGSFAGAIAWHNANNWY